MNRSIKRTVRVGLAAAVAVGVLGVLLGHVDLSLRDAFALSQLPNPNCTPNGNEVPLGQSQPSDEDPLRAIWCFTLNSGPTTRVTGANDWVDEFATNTELQHLNDTELGYRVYAEDSSGRITNQTFVNENYWQTDIVDTSIYNLSGGVLVSPNRAFQFENGRLVLDFEGAPGNWNTGGADVFYEVDVSPAPGPTGQTVDTLYGYGVFGGVGAIGCRLQRQDEGFGPQGVTVCAQYDNSGRGPGDGGRLWETQGGGNSVIAATNNTPNPSGWWRQCQTNQSDDFCRDRFRLELTKDSLKLYVNGFLARDLEGIYAVNPLTGRDNRVPDSWFGSAGVHVFLTSWINTGQHHVERFKWGRIAVNQHDASGAIVPPSTADTFCFGQPQSTCAAGSPAPGATSSPVSATTNTPVPTATRTTTPVPSVTNTPAPTASRTSTAVPTFTSTPAPTSTLAATPTRTPTATSTPKGGGKGNTGGGGNKKTPTATATLPVPPSSTTINFNDLSSPQRPLTGQYPTGVIDWGIGGWYLSGPWGKFSDNSVSFTDNRMTSSFTFVQPRMLLGLGAYNGGTTASTITLNCAGQLSKQVVLQPNQVTTIQTGWTGKCSSVSISSTNGWYTNFDNFVIK
jgi:hypothetical protein